MRINFKYPPELEELIHNYGHLYEKLIDRSRAVYILVLIFTFVHIIIHPLPVLKRVKNAYTNEMHELKGDERNLFFVSAYYYGKEYSLYENQVSLVFVAPRDAHWERRNIVVIRSNETNSVLENMKVRRATPHNVCKFVTLVGSVILKDELVNLEILVNRNFADVRYLPADNEKRDLVVCTPPIYHSVRWQNVLFTPHVYSKFDGHIQFYIYSVTPVLFELFEELKRLKGVSVDALPDFYGSPHLGDIEFGGVTVANCDCLNKYKSSTSFITFLEWDEILLPKSQESYFFEFAHYFESEIYVGMLEFTNPKGHSKTVTRPLLIDSVWINEPVEKPYKMRNKRMTSNKVYQLTDEDQLDSMAEGNFPGSEILKTDDIQAIVKDFKRTLKDAKISEIISRLSLEKPVFCQKTRIGYYTSYSRLECPGPHLCAAPSKFSCIKTDAQFELLNYTTNFYQPYSHAFNTSVCTI